MWEKVLGEATRGVITNLKYCLCEVFKVMYMHLFNKNVKMAKNGLLCSKGQVGMQRR